MDKLGADFSILVVEDDESVADFLSLAIGELAGCQVMVAPDGETALALVHEEKPRGVLLDIMLPGMTGFAVFDQLRSQADTARIPVIFMSCLDGYQSELRQRGVRSFLAKPFGLDRLEQTLSDALGLNRPVAA